MIFQNLNCAKLNYFDATNNMHDDSTSLAHFSLAQLLIAKNYCRKKVSSETFMAAQLSKAHTLTRENCHCRKYI